VRLDTENMAEYRVPASWGGRLYAVWALVSYTKGSERIGYESTTAIFPLGGGRDGCQELLASGTSVFG
jgi:hypothetical protein